MRKWSIPFAIIAILRVEMCQTNPHFFILYLKTILDIPGSSATTGRRLAIPDCIPHLLRPHSAKV